MGAAGRWVVALAGVAVLGIAGHHAWRLGQAESALTQASLKLEALGTTAGEDWLAVRDALQQALARSPGDPAAHELLGILHATRLDAPPLLEQSLGHLVASIARRPTSPYSWANYARASYDLGRTGEPYAAALRAAAFLGPGEPEVQETVADLGLATWEETSAATRESVDGALRRGMARDPVRLLQIAGRRGRLAAACRHLKDGDARIEKTPQATACDNAKTGTKT